MEATDPDQGLGGQHFVDTGRSPVESAPRGTPQAPWAAQCVAVQHLSHQRVITFTYL